MPTNAMFTFLVVIPFVDVNGVPTGRVYLINLVAIRETALIIIMLNTK
jgi:hypothetical protein